MTNPDSNPKLPLWIFLVFDALLIATAGFVAYSSKKPLSFEAALVISGCIAAGAVIIFIPIVSRFEQAKNETLDERQRSLEALARTLGSAAEQISIAASGLHEIADIAQKNLKHAEQLPHKLQEKIAEFQAQLKDANDTEKEELEKEVAELRASETERIETAATKVSKAVADFAKLEAATQQQLAAAHEALGKLSFGAAGAIGKAQAAAEQAFAQARTEAARGLGETAGQAAKTIEAAKTAALADIDAKLAAFGAALVEKLARESMKSTAATPAPAATPASAEAPPAKPEADPAPAAASEPAQPPKRPRKRREESPAPDPLPTDSPVADAPVADAPVTDTPGPDVATPASEDAAPTPVAEEPPPVSLAQIPEVAPIAPHTAEPFPGNIDLAPEAAASASAPADTPVEAPVATATEAPKAPRKRAPKKTEPAPEATEADAKADLKLDLDDTPARPAAEMAERVLSSDGATRLLVTAYIGIGNRLFIRGAGPGLSWEKGVPLQFVSIGKWRWETNDASGAVEFKLYKNDDVECSALGAQKLDPGYQQEVTASF
jgi:F0F1-type ATP synthase membrane subunit b/b'